MIIRVLSDLHSEFFNFNKINKLLRTILPPDDRDKDSILLLAGDIGTFAKYPSTLKPVIKELAPRFRKVFMIYGNHSWYFSDLWYSYKTFWDDKRLPENFFILDDTYLIVDNVAFIGGTLWTSLNSRDPIAMWHAERNMNDYNNIRYHSIPDSPYSRSGTRISAESTVARHEVTRDFIFQAIPLLKDAGMKTVVLTHHAPSFQSIHERYRGDLLNYAFASDLDEKILETQPDLWVHAHMHDSKDYYIGTTRILCNPYGYHGIEEVKDYNPRLLLNI